MTLFADRARRAEPGFTLDQQTRKTVAELVARLDGMPLAIELAAARVDALGVTQLLDRIDDRFVLLVDGDRLAEQRQRSLAAAVRWSYELLDDDEQRTFRALSAFPGPFTLDGAEAVAGPGAGPAVPRLVDRSLLVPPRAGPDGRTRYAMLETLRAYGAGLLAEAGEDGDVTAALAGYAAEVAEQASAGLYTRTGEAASLRQLDAEDVTLRHALDWAMEHDPDTALRLALSQAQLWSIRGRLISQAPVLAAAAEHAEAGSGEWCGARMLLAQAASYASDPLAALEHYDTVRNVLEDPARPASREGPVLLSLCLDGRSAALLQMGRVAEAVDDARRALAVARQAGSQGLEASRPGLPGRGRVAGRRPGRRAPDRARGAGHPGRVRRRAVPGAELVHRDDPDRGRRPGRRRTGLRGRPGLVPGRGRPGQPQQPAVEPGDPGPAGRPHRRRGGTPARAASDRRADRGCAVPS